MISNEHKRFLTVLGILALIGLVLSLFKPPVESVLATSFDGRTMGTYYIVTIAGVELPDAETDRLHRLVEAELRDINQAMSTYIPDSEISRFNAAPAAEPFAISPSFRQVMERAFDLHEKLNGYFDPTLSPLINLWGFGHTGAPEHAPGEEEIARLLDRVGLHRIQLTDDGLVKESPELELNLSAIAKGFAADQLADLLFNEGYVNVFIEIGGDLAVRGKNPAGGPWRIGIQVPERDGPEDILKIIGMESGGMATSGDYRIYRENPDGFSHHILHPHTGRPVLSTLTSVTVIAKDCMTADAISTGLFVMGTEAGLNWVNSQPGVEALFIDRDNGGFTRTASEGFNRHVLESL
ncbi:MAG: FAD:protein FMN transferase [Verrucomicrobia bacterium]|nr:FAD:protein FMN transferase [Verrucomicrobiota bacterium]MCH8527578.1 FAD:protein FMN transferase [Kiritimatiellia bacterium]